MIYKNGDHDLHRLLAKEAEKQGRSATGGRREFEKRWASRTSGIARCLDGIGVQHNDSFARVLAAHNVNEQLRCIVQARHDALTVAQLATRDLPRDARVECSGILSLMVVDEEAADRQALVEHVDEVRYRFQSIFFRIQSIYIVLNVKDYN